MMHRIGILCDQGRHGPSAVEPAAFSARGSIIAFLVALLLSLACSSHDVVPVRAILAHPDAFADTIITVRGSISKEGVALPFTSVVVRKFTDAESDTISIVTVPDTLAGRTVRIKGVVLVLDLGLARIGPVIVVGYLRAALPGAAGGPSR